MPVRRASDQVLISRRPGAAHDLAERQRAADRGPTRIRCASSSSRSRGSSTARRTRSCCRRTAGRSAGCTGASTCCARTISQQLDDLREACREPQAAYDLLPVMYGRPLRGYHRFLALGETVAHLNYLWHAGELARTVDDAGRIHFVAG